jgi:hypothetical protein
MAMPTAKPGSRRIDIPFQQRTGRFYRPVARVQRRARHLAVGRRPDFLRIDAKGGQPLSWGASQPQKVGSGFVVPESGEAPGKEPQVVRTTEG